jgi:hypothetical protein
MLASNVDDITSHETSNTRRTSHWFVRLRLLLEHERGSWRAARVMWTRTSLDYSLYTLRVNIRILTRRSLASNWSSVDDDLRAQVRARRVSRRAQAWRAPTRVMWTGLKVRTEFSYFGGNVVLKMLRDIHVSYEIISAHYFPWNTLIIVSAPSSQQNIVSHTVCG